MRLLDRFRSSPKPIAKGLTMRRVATLSTAGLLAALPFLGTGCVQQDRYDQMLHANRSLEEQNVRLRDDLDVAQANLDRTQGDLATARSEVRGLQDREGEFQTELDRIAKDFDTIDQQFRTMSTGPLPMDVSRALDDLAAAYPDMLVFDPSMGMLQFPSDLTFALGSDELRPQAAATLTSVADILNEASARGLEVRVVGHTDNVPIRRAATRERHPSNMHLSVHRAISVRDALTSAGVDPVRLLVAGCGEYRPVVTNGVRGSAENRRVEVFLAPMPNSPGATRMPAQRTTQATTDYVEPMK